MVNKLLGKAIKELKRVGFDAYIFTLSNENLYEFVDDFENPLIELSGFTGDTGELILMRDKAYLLVDGRFIIQAKKEKNDSRIEIIEMGNGKSAFDYYCKIFKNGFKVGINPKLRSISKTLKFEKTLGRFGVIIKYNETFFEKEIKDVKKNYFRMTSAPLYMLDSRYVSSDVNKKIKVLFDKMDIVLDDSVANNVINSDNYGTATIACDKNYRKEKLYYVTSSQEEIAYITNLRYRFADINDHGPLFKAFLIANIKHSVLYIDDYLEDGALTYFNKANIEIKPYKEFYKDIRLIKDKKYLFLDSSINNYYTYKIASLAKDNIIISPIYDTMSIRNDLELKNMRKCNVIDGVAITKAIYNVKTNGKYKNEYEIKEMVDNKRKEIGKDKFLCNSFKTIVAYKENSAICHYIPKKDASKNINGEGVLLIDSGGNYLYGTTDITRTLSLYKNKKNIPAIVKKHYTMVLNSMLKLSMQRFPYGITGVELDIVARSSLYNEHLDYNHGTGHGIGYISNVHDGPNRISPGMQKLSIKNIYEVGQVVSDEPGIYIEGKYGIRIENDLISVQDKKNEFGDFIRFETLTLCPYDKDLIDKKYLEKNCYEYLKAYNKLVYKKLSPYMNKKEKVWLKEMTCL